MKTKITRGRRAHTGIGTPLILLLSVIACALMWSFRPEGKALLIGEKLLPFLTVLPLFFAGNVFGVYVIPAAGLVFGLCAESALKAHHVSGMAEFSTLLPLLMLTPGFFLTAAAGMRLSEDCLNAACSEEGFRGLLVRQAAICGLALAFLLVYHLFL